MNLDSFYGIIIAAVLEVVLGALLTLVASFILPASALATIADSSILNTVFVTIFFTISFSIVIYLFRNKTKDKKTLAKKFFLVFLVFYILNPIFTRDITTLYVAIIFPVIAYFLTLFIAKDIKPV